MPMKSKWGSEPRSPALTALATAAERAEAFAWADAFSGVADLFQAEAAVIGGAQLTRVGAAPAPYFAKVIGLGLEAPASREDIRAIIDWYDERGTSEFWFQPSPAALPDNLLQLLTDEGLGPVPRRWGKFVRDVRDAQEVSTDLEVEEVGPANAEDFARAMAAGFGLPDALVPWVRSIPGRPGWKTYVAYDGSEPVATGAVAISGRSAWLGCGATMPEHRRRGAQRALLARRIRDARAAGCAVLTTETGVDETGPGPSWRNITNAGFELLYVRPNYARKASSI